MIINKHKWNIGFFTISMELEASYQILTIVHNKPFLGNEVYHFDIKTKLTKKKVWSHLPNCTSAFRWLEHYYCFHGHNFTRFHPISGEVTGVYPKDARNYFMRCGEGFGEFMYLFKRNQDILLCITFHLMSSWIGSLGHGAGTRKLQCSDIKLNAITTDDKGTAYAFQGNSTLWQDMTQALQVWNYIC